MQLLARNRFSTSCDLNDTALDGRLVKTSQFKKVQLCELILKGICMQQFSTQIENNIIYLLTEHAFLLFTKFISERTPLCRRFICTFSQLAASQKLISVGDILFTKTCSVAQLVERQAIVPKVPGSIPRRANFFFFIFWMNSGKVTVRHS